MNKNTILYLVLAINLAAGICLNFFTDLHYLAGIWTGAVAMLIIFNTIGKWQAKKAAEKIDVLISQKKGNHHH